jgi:hypothetical protein
VRLQLVVGQRSSHANVGGRLLIKWNTNEYKVFIVDRGLFPRSLLEGKGWTAAYRTQNIFVAIPV